MPTLIKEKKKVNVKQLCVDLQQFEKKRVYVIKLINMNKNSIRAYVAGKLGYSTKMEEGERKKLHKEAQALIDKIMLGKAHTPYEDIVITGMLSVVPLNDLRKRLELDMEDLAQQLPVAEWTKKIRGFGMTSQLFLAIVIGETGDLSNYDLPGKVWRRLGCAPWKFKGKNLAGSTWRKGKDNVSLPAEEWEKYGYSPRRKSVSFLIGDGLMKNNNGVYRLRYEQAKEKMQREHSDYPKMRCHLHGITCAAKLLLKHLWMQWNPELVRTKQWS